MSDPRDLLTAFARPVRHEVNNLLAALSGTAELMRRSPTSTERDIVRAERLLDASARLQALLHAYLALGAPPPNGTAAAAVLDAMVPLVRLALGPGRDVEAVTADGLPALAATPQALQAAILGLARDAAALAPPQAGLRLSLVTAPGGVLLAARPTPSGDAPAPVFLPAAPP